MKRILEVAHHEDDYSCMWNGVEDLYTNKTGETLPPKFFYVLSSFGSFCYRKTPKAEIKRMVMLGDGRTRQMYAFLAPIVGFDYKVFEYKTFDKALRKIKSEINSGFPCVIGALDMFYLPYFKKIYHSEHIPFHYVLVTGYDDEEKLLYFSDCGRKDTVSVSYEEIALALDCSYPSLSKPNTVWTIRMHPSKGKYEIAKEALNMKKELFLHPPVSFLGYSGFEKFIEELPNWKDELSEKDYNNILCQIVQFLGAVPTIPNAIRGIDETDNIPFAGGFDKASVVLESLAKEYHDKSMLEASTLFSKAVPIIGEIKEVIVGYLTKKEDRTNELPMLFGQAKDIMRIGFERLEL